MPHNSRVMINTTWLDNDRTLGAIKRQMIINEIKIHTVYRTRQIYKKNSIAYMSYVNSLTVSLAWNLLSSPEFKEPREAMKKDTASSLLKFLPWLSGSPSRVRLRQTDLGRARERIDLLTTDSLVLYTTSQFWVTGCLVVMSILG